MEYISAFVKLLKKERTMKRSINKLRELVQGEVIENEVMANHTSFHIGGPAEIFCKPKNLEDIENIIKWARKNRLPIFTIGNGTNLLVSDKGVSGVVIQISSTMKDIQFDKNTVFVQGGLSIQELIDRSMKRGLGGIEFASNIPGTAGGSITMNAGSNSYFLSKYVKYVDVIGLDGKKRRMFHDDLKFNYRYSILQDEPLILLNALFALEKRDQMEIKREIERFKSMKKKRQPIDYPCAGSIFKNPPTTYAGKVLEETGCKGMRIGDAMVSDMHANFIINLGNATAADVMSLIQRAQHQVYRKKDLILELEIKLIGDFRR